MGKSQNLSVFVCGGVSYSQVHPYIVLSYTRVSTVCENPAVITASCREVLWHLPGGGAIMTTV